MQSHGLENKITFQTNVSSELYGCAAHLNKPRSSFKSRTQILVVNTYGLKGMFNVVNFMLAIIHLLHCIEQNKHQNRTKTKH